MTVQTAGLIVLACLFIGMLLGTAWTFQAVQPNLRRQAEERRQINAEWQAVRDAQQSVHFVRCPRCGCRLSSADRYFDDEDEDEDEEPDDE